MADKCTVKIIKKVSPVPRLLFEQVTQLIRDIENIPELNEERKNFQISCLISDSLFSGLDDMSQQVGEDIKLLCQLIVPNFDTPQLRPILDNELKRIFAKLFSTGELVTRHSTSPLLNIICYYFVRNNRINPVVNNTLTVLEISEFMEKVQGAADENERFSHIADVVPRCTVEELRLILKFLTNNIPIVSVKNILDILHPEAFQEYQEKDFDSAISKYLFEVYPFKPIRNQLISECRTVGEAIIKCENGAICTSDLESRFIYIHKMHDQIRYYSRTTDIPYESEIEKILWKITEVFPETHKFILECQVRERSTIQSFTETTYVQIIINDCMYFDNDMTKEPFWRRRQLLQQNIFEKPGFIILSEAREISCIEDLNKFIRDNPFDHLLFKDRESRYENSNTTWLGIHRNYIDTLHVTLDLVPVGGWREIDREDKIYWIFLMGCYDSAEKKFRTVVKVKGDHRFHLNQDDMIEINCDPERVPHWLRCENCMVPEYVVMDPETQPVFTVAGIELIHGKEHSANHISLLYPTLTRLQTEMNFNQVSDLKALLNKNEQLNVHLIEVRKPENNPFYKLERFEDIAAPAASSSEPDESQNLAPYFINSNIKLADEETVLLWRWLYYELRLRENPSFAAFVVHAHDTYAPVTRDATHVTIQWVLDCIAYKCLRNPESYVLTACRRLELRQVCLFINDLNKCQTDFDISCLMSKMFFAERNVVGLYFEDDIKLLCQLLCIEFDTDSIPIEHGTLISVFRELFDTRAVYELKDCTLDDIIVGIGRHFQGNDVVTPAKKNSLELSEVVEFMRKVRHADDEQIVSEDEIVSYIRNVIHKCTLEELTMILKLLTKNIPFRISVQHVLDVIHAEAFKEYQKNNFDSAISKYLHEPYPLKPIVPAKMKHCHSILEALLGCNNDALCQIDYGGERFHVHRKNKEIRYYPILGYTNFASKLKTLPEKVFEAFPHTQEFIMDCQLCTYDATGKPIKAVTNEIIEYVILVNDCMYLDGDITKVPFLIRSELLKQRHVIQPSNFVRLSELKSCSSTEELSEIVSELLQYDFGGLVFRRRDGIYLTEGTNSYRIHRNMINYHISVDLLVLGGWLETNLENETYWIFLMGCFDSENNNFCTVVKVRADPGIQLDADSVLKISGDINKLPTWLRLSSPDMVPEYVAKDPKAQTVWTVSGLDYSLNKKDSADEISLFYPKLTKAQTEMNWNQVIDLVTLRNKYHEYHSKIEILAEEATKRIDIRESKEPTPEPSTETTASEPLPQYFKDIRIYVIDENRNTSTSWINCFKQCGGTEIDEDKEANYILHVGYNIPIERADYWKEKDVKHVGIDWIVDSLLLGSVQYSGSSVFDTLRFKDISQLIKSLAALTPLCTNLDKSSLLSKTFFKEGNGLVAHFPEHVKLLCKLIERNVDSSQSPPIEDTELERIFSELFLIENLHVSDHPRFGITDRICYYFNNNKNIKPAVDCTLTFFQIAELILKMHETTTPDVKFQYFAKIIPKCSSAALRMILQLLKNTIRFNCSVENILDIIHENAFKLYQQNKNIDAVLSNYLHVPYPMKPIVKVVPKTCESVYEALSQCSNPFCGIDFGGTKFHVNRKNYHVQYYHDYINTEKTKPYQFNLLNEKITTYAFPYSPELILDCQILNIDRSQTTPVVLIHDCMYLDGDITMKPLKRRRQLVEKRIIQDDDIYIYQLKEISTVEDVNVMISKLVQYDFGELFFRDGNKAYEKENTWFKIDRNYFNKYRVQVNLLVLGGWLETDLEDETYWIFLMGCFDSASDNFCTIVKVRSDPGIKLDENSMIKINGDIAKVPDWLRCKDSMVPEYVANDPYGAKVYIVSGIELFPNCDHTADGISLLYPKLTEAKTEINWDRAVDLATFRQIYSKQQIRVKPPVQTVSSLYSEIDTFEELKPIPKYFKDICICFHEDVNRRWIDCVDKCGGTIVHDLEEASYMVYTDIDSWNETSVPRINLIEVRVKWILKTVERGYLQDDRQYRITLTEALRFHQVSKLIDDVKDIDQASHVTISVSNRKDQKSYLISKMFFAQWGVIGVFFQEEIKSLCKLLVPNFDGSQPPSITETELRRIFSKLDSMCQSPDVQIVASTLPLLKIAKLIDNIYNAANENQRIRYFKTMFSELSPDDLETVINLLTNRIPIERWVERILNILHSDAFKFYQTYGIEAAIERFVWEPYPLKPLLYVTSENCKSVNEAMLKCWDGAYCQIDCGGDRLQIHKKKDQIRAYFYCKNYSPEVVLGIQELVEKAFPQSHELILDCQAIWYNPRTKKRITVPSKTHTIIIDDCMYLNGDITGELLERRRQNLQEIISIMPESITISELKKIEHIEELNEIIRRVLQDDSANLLIKGNNTYESGKTKWFKINRDYFKDNRVRVDLLVLGGWHVTDLEDEPYWIFLMGCYDSESDNFCTVVEVRANSGIHLDENSMIKINGDIAKVPAWLRCNNSVVPIYVANDPHTDQTVQSVWTVTGIDWIYDKGHTANQISILYPKLEKHQTEKNWLQADNLIALQRTIHYPHDPRLITETTPERRPLLKRKAEDPIPGTSKKLAPSILSLAEPVILGEPMLIEDDSDEEESS